MGLTITINGANDVTPDRWIAMAASVVFEANPADGSNPDAGSLTQR
ncbi:hypothetical protein [Gallaecimonas pentaromativorans]